MVRNIKLKYLVSFLFAGFVFGCQHSTHVDLENIFHNPPESAKPWVYWFWMNAAVSEEGITADLEAMKENGIGGAYLFFVQGPTDPPLFSPPTVQLSPEWWDILSFTFNEAERIGIQLAIHSCDGFTVAGGPWITPDLSMQKVVWSDMNIQGGMPYHDTLPQPETIEGYYRDIAVFAYPTPSDYYYSSDRIKPVVTANTTNEDLGYLSDPDNEKLFRSYDPCRIQYEFEEPFTCHSVLIRSAAYNMAPNHLIVESSDDGVNFSYVCRLEPPRHGWQDYEADNTHSIPRTTAKYFRFTYNTDGVEPGSEDLETAKWNPSLRIKGIILSGKPNIHQYEGKNGSIWRVGKKSTTDQLPDSVCIPMDQLRDISVDLDSLGILTWQVPKGNWTVLRIGHTSTGHTNYMGGGGKGLECDKFNPEAVTLQFNEWFRKIYEASGASPDILKKFYIDSWECGSQNWSSVFAEEFKKRRGYDLHPWLPVMTGLPVESAENSERILHDVRNTIAELMDENFFGTLQQLVHDKACQFAAESTSPVMSGDGMLHFNRVDIPMGEFWLNSPTHDKPNDMLDAISAAHIYDKQIVQAESFSTLRMDWSEHPGMLKPFADRNFALGINRLVFHVFTHNPWLDRKPGMTLNGAGLYFQRDQTWWDPSKDWINYIQRCQAMLQLGDPVVDIAVFTGEEIPRRALTPDRLMNVIPGLFSTGMIDYEMERLDNKGVPMQEIPKGVNNTKNTFNLNNWLDPLNGYKYDCINRDALLRLAKVKDGRIVLPGGASYGVLVIPGMRKMDPNFRMSVQVAKKISELVKAGATVIFNGYPIQIPGRGSETDNDNKLQMLISELNEGNFQSVGAGEETIYLKKLKNGSVIKAPFRAQSLDVLGISRDLTAVNDIDMPVQNICWTHRKNDSFDIYFVSNQSAKNIEFTASLRSVGRYPELFDPVTGDVDFAKKWNIKNDRTEIPIKLDPYGSVFIVLRKITSETGKSSGENWLGYITIQSVEEPWTVEFDRTFGGPVHPVMFTELKDWTTSSNDSIRYYSGTAVYKNTFQYKASPDTLERIWIDLGRIENIGEVILNGEFCGTAWTYPYRVEITYHIKQGSNELNLLITNTWHNRLIRDNELPFEDRITWTNAPFRLKGEPLISSGLFGPVTVIKENFD